MYTSSFLPSAGGVSRLMNCLTHWCGYLVGLGFLKRSDDSLVVNMKLLNFLFSTRILLIYQLRVFFGLKYKQQNNVS